MEKELHEGAKSLVERILSDAQKEADAMLKSAKEEIETIKARAALREVELQKQLEEEREKLSASILERSRTNAALEARKYSLYAKRRVLQESFDQAYERLLSLSGEKRKSLLLACLLKEAEGGESLLANEGDRKILETLLPAVNSEFEKQGKAPLKLAEERGEMDGGFLLLGETYEKNCSFRALLQLQREAEESRVASILFR